MASLSQSDHILIIGGGFSGTLLAINILRHDGPRVTLVERRNDQVGRGVAYSAADPTHLLNVRASNMSALPDAPDHLVRWLAERGGDTPQSFIPRTLYGEYLREMLNEARVRAGDRFTLVAGEAVAILPLQAGGYRVMFADGSSQESGRIVLTIGNLPPHDPPGLVADALPPDSYAADPWAADIARDLTPDDRVVLLGTGLTAIDAALLLGQRGFTGKILSVSRRGLVPRAHWPEGPKVTGRNEKVQGNLSAIVRQLRARAQKVDWRIAVDELRPVTQIMWAAADNRVRARFLRHVRPFWDVHRHRLSPAIAARIAAMEASGQLRFAAGKIMDAQADGDGAILHWRPRHGDAPVATRARRIVNCTGPQGDLLRSDEPLLRQLRDSGQIRPDALRLGLDVDAQSRVISATGVPQEGLLCVGPMTRGGMWEVVAVPDLRRQSWDLARRLSNAHWAGGEGL